MKGSSAFIEGFFRLHRNENVMTTLLHLTKTINMNLIDVCVVVVTSTEFGLAAIVPHAPSASGTQTTACRSDHIHMRD